MTPRLFVCIALLVCVAPLGARADHPITVTTCDDALARATRDALELELHVGPGEATLDQMVLRIDAPCEGTARVTLEDSMTELTFERDVALGELPRSLHARMLALVAGELERLARRARASRLAEPLPSMLDAVTSPPREVEDAPTPRSTQAPPTEELDVPPTRRAPRTATLEALATVRVYLSDRLSLGGSGVAFSRARLSIGASAVGARRTVSDGKLGLLVTSLDIGARVYPAPESSSVFALHVRGEVGLARVEGSPADRGGAIGRVSYSPVVAGMLEARIQLTAREAAVRFCLALDVGYTSGPRIRGLSGEDLVRLHGPLLTASMGLGF